MLVHRKLEKKERSNSIAAKADSEYRSKEQTPALVDGTPWMAEPHPLHQKVISLISGQSTDPGFRLDPQ